MVEAWLSPKAQRIVIALNRSKRKCLSTEELSRESGITRSTIGSDQKILISLDVLRKNQRRLMNQGKISVRIEYELTAKGKLIATHLDAISNLLKDSKNGLPETGAFQSARTELK